MGPRAGKCLWGQDGLRADEDGHVPIGRIAPLGQDSLQADEDDHVPNGRIVPTRAGKSSGG